MFKRSFVGLFHGVNTKHSDGYLSEFELRFNNRPKQFLFRDTLVKLIQSEPLRYKN